MRHLLAAAAVALAAIFFGTLSAGGSSTSFAKHPRIFLTPGTLTSLRHRAAAGSASWKALKARCNLYLSGTVEWPNGKDYPSGDGSIGEGYQGDGYFAPIANLGLCYRIVRPSKPKLAAKYAAKGVNVLTKMSAPYGAGKHGENPLRDDGYGVRNYGTGMALGFDWLYPALSTSLKTRIDKSENAWLKAFAGGGFEHNFPQGNYFAGYYDAKALAGLALAGSTKHGTSLWKSWLASLHNGFVQQYYAKNLSSGGWPEGWNYGPRGVLNMSWPALAAKTGAGLDLIHAAGRPYAFPTNAPRYDMYFTWPDLKTMDDDGLVYEGDNPSAARPSFFGNEAGLLTALRDPFAPAFHSFAQAVRQVAPAEEEGPDAHLWEDFLFWNPSAPSASFTGQPLSYLAHGMDRGAMRSSWSTAAVWASFMGGPHTNFPDAGEEFPDTGSLSIVRGNRPLLVNTWGTLLRNTPGTTDGTQYFDPLYNDVFNGERDIFNIFYAGSATPGQGAYLRSGGNRTAMTRFEDKGSYVAMRASHLEDNYPQNSGAAKSITSWTRDVVYLRPELFVVYDRTTVTSPSVTQWMSFHLGHETSEGAAPDTGIRRWDVGAGASYAGTVETVLPAGHLDTVAGLFGQRKVDRLTVKPGTAAAQNRWLTVFDPALTPASAARALNLSVQTGPVLGVVLRTSTKNYTVVAGSGPAGTPVTGEVKYTVPAVQTLHVVQDLQPTTAYSVSASVSGANVVVDVKPGSGHTTSATGVLSFTTSATGAITRASP
jgi:hypothetical protein